MDHHCYWVGNCVALYNQKQFNMFLVNAILGSAMIAYAICIVLYKKVPVMLWFASMYRVEYQFIMTGTIACLLVLCLSILLGSQTYVIYFNSSTLENT